MRCVHKIAVIIGVCSSFMVKHFPREIYTLCMCGFKEKNFSENIGNENISGNNISFDREMNMFSFATRQLLQS